MKYLTSILSSTTLVTAVTLMGAVAPRIAAADPQISMRQEEAAHPRLVQAIREMKEALHELEAAPDDFGGNKAAAIRDTRQAIHSVRKALYFRLKLDDAAIDRLP